MLYNLLIERDLDACPHPYMMKWERDLGIKMTLTDLQRIWDNATKTSIYTVTREGIYKIMMRWYHTPTLLHKLFPQSSTQECWRCGQTEGTLIHIFWECPDMVASWLSKVLLTEICKNPKIFLPGGKIEHINKLSQRLVNSILTAASGLIAKHWKNPSAPTERELTDRIQYFRRMEYLTAVKNSSVEQFDNICYNWDTFSEGSIASS